MTRTRLSGLLFLTFVTALTASSAEAGIMLQGFYHEPDTSKNWWEHMADIGPEVRTAGVTGIWIPAPTKGSSGGFSSGYDPYDLYDLGSKDQRSTVPTRFGSKEDLLAMIAVLHRLGIDVYADAVVNHRSGGDNGGYDYNPRGSEGPGRLPMSRRDFNDPYASDDWRKDVGGGRDLNQNEPWVRHGLQQWLKWFDNQTNVDGYRIDAAKHMDPWFIEGLLYQVQEGNFKNPGKRFVVSEFFDGNPYILGDYIHRTKRRSSVFDFGLRYNIKDVVHGNGFNDIRSVMFHLKDYAKSVPFINNHDTFDRGNGDDIFWRANLAHCMILTMPGYPCVFYKDLFDSRGWIRPYLRTLMWVNTFCAQGDYRERWADGDLLVTERPGRLLTGMNDNNNDWRKAWVKTDFGGNRWLHDYTGIGPDIWTNEHGYAEVAVPPGGYVNYAPAFTEGTPWPPARRTVQEWQAAADLDTRPAGEWWSEPVRIVSEKDAPIYVDLYLDDKTVEAHVALFDWNGNLLSTAKGKGGHVYLSWLNPPEVSWYQVRVALTRTGQNKRSDYTLKIGYEGSPWFPKKRPPQGNTDAAAPPLR